MVSERVETNAMQARLPHLEVRVGEQLGEPGLRVEGDLLEELLVEEVEDDAVAGLLEEAPEGGLQLLEAGRVGRVEQQDLARVLGRLHVPLGVQLGPRPLGLDGGRRVQRRLREALEGDRLVARMAAAVQLQAPPPAGRAAAAVAAAAVDAADGAEAREDEDGRAGHHDVQPAALDVTEMER